MALTRTLFPIGAYSRTHRTAANTVSQHGQLLWSRAFGTLQFSSPIAKADSSTTSSYPIDVPFPELDAFPNNLFGISDRATMGIRAALTTTSETKTRLKDMSHLISRAIAVDDREALLNDLAVLGEAYEEGWQSNSESDSND